MLTSLACRNKSDLGIYIFIDVNIYSCIHIYSCICILVICIYIMYVYTCTCYMCVNMYKYTCVYNYMLTSLACRTKSELGMYTHICVSMDMFLYSHVFIYKYIHTCIYAYHIFIYIMKIFYSM
jgi:hypothetical protein